MTSEYQRDPEPAGGSADTSVGIIVVNYGSADLLERHLAPLTEATGQLGVVVDNPTTSAERSRVRALADTYGWTLEEPARNLGFGGGVNCGARAALAAGAEVLVTLNPDAALTPESLGLLVTQVREHPDTMVAPLIRTSSGQVWFDGAGLDLRTGATLTSDRLGEPGVEPWLTGACLAISAELWNRVGGFDDDYFLYWEDVDLSRRVRQAGGHLLVLRQATAVHDEGGTQGLGSASRAKSDTYYYFNIRNRMLYARRFLIRATRRRWLFRSGPEAYAILLRGGRRQFVHRPQVFATAARAVLDGALGRVGPRAAAVATELASTTPPDTPPPDTQATDAAAADTPPDGTPADGGAPLRVLQTYMRPLPFHNPYVKLHDGSLRAAGHTVLHFDWRTALAGRYDVVHAHWPEDVLEATSTLKGWGKRAAMALWLAQLRARRIPIVRTVHNLELPSQIDPVKRRLLQAVQQQTGHRVLISRTTPIPDGPHSVVLHGHFVDWLAEHPRNERVPGRIAYIGLIRRYKNVEALARVFASTASDHSDWTLQIAGNPSSDELADALRSAVGEDARAELILRYLSDAEIVQIITASALVVLPYKEMHNSGSLLTALSLGRPALVPDNAANRAIRDEVGDAWVQLYTGDLSVSDLERALAATADLDLGAGPDLSGRDWQTSAAGHVAAFRAAIEHAGRRPR